MYEESRAAQRGEDPLAVIEEELRIEAELEAEEEAEAGRAPEEDDEEAAERKRLAMEERRKQKMYQRAVRFLDPEVLAAQFLKPEDQAIKERDFPERLQLAGVSPAEVRLAGLCLIKRVACSVV